MKIAIGTDHAGFEQKARIAEWLRSEGHEVADLGVDSAEPFDYPDKARDLARAVAAGEAELGVLICGTGNGMAMAANKVRGIRAAVCNDEFSAEMARRHNHANVISVGARIVGEELMKRVLRVFLEAPEEGGRNERRVAKIMDIEAGASERGG